MTYTPVFQANGVLLRHLRGYGSHINEDRAGLHASNGTAIEEHLAHHRPAVENGKDVVGALDRFGRRIGDGAAGLLDWRCFARGAVPSHDIEAGAHEIHSHGCAHNTQSKKGN